MKQKRYSAGYILLKLRDAKADLAAGLVIGRVCQKLGVRRAAVPPDFNV